MALLLRLAFADAQSFVIAIFENAISALCLTVHMQDNSHVQIFRDGQPRL